MKHFIITTLLLTSSFWTATISYAHDVEIGGIYYNLNKKDKTATVTYKGDDYDAYDEYQGSVVIPSGITYSGEDYSVKYIGKSAFQNCRHLTNVEIPRSVREIWVDAFRNCSRLTNIVINDGVIRIRNKAFNGCTDLKSVYLPNSLTTIDNEAFYGCTHLTSIYIPNSVTYIGEQSFKNCTSLSTISLPNSTPRVGADIFCNCTNLTTIDIPNSWTDIPPGMFRGCSELTTVNIPNSVREIRYSAFNSCSKLSNLTLPNFLTDLGGNAFSNCSNLKEMIVPNSLTEMGTWVFYGCCLTPLCFTNEFTLQLQEFFGLDTLSTIIAPPAMIPAIKEQFRGTVQSCPYCVDIRSTFVQEIKFSLTDYRHLYRAYGEFELTKVCVAGKEIVPDQDGIYSAGNLQPRETYPCEVYFKENGRDTIHTIDIRTADPAIQIPAEAYSSTHSTITVEEIAADSDPTATITERGVQIKDTHYVKEGDAPLKIGNLDPNTIYTVIPYAIYNGKTVYGTPSKIKTSQLRITIENPSVHATTFSCSGVYEAGDAVIIDENLTIALNSKNKSAVIFRNGRQAYLTGLTPNSSYTINYFIKFPSGKRAHSPSHTFTTPELEMETLAPKIASGSAAVVCARTNIADEESAVGFEWRKENAPADEAPASCEGVLYGGQLESRIAGLAAGTRYQVRSYYESAAGERFHGEWIGFDTGRPSYLDPSVHTYANAFVHENSATMTGYAIAGTDEITEQGFEYRIADAQGNTAAPAETLPASGIRMTATASGLIPGATYRFRAYAKIRQKMTYGEEREFTLPQAAGIGEVVSDRDPEPEIALRDLSAQGRIEVRVTDRTDTRRRITLFNLNGQPAATAETAPGGQWTSIPTTSLPAGIYLLHVEGTAKPLKLSLR